MGLLAQMHPLDMQLALTRILANRGLAFGKAVQVYFDDQSVLVRPEVASAQSTAAVAIPSEARVYQPAVTQTAPAKPCLTTRYHGTVSIDPQRVNKEMGIIVEEIIQRLTSLTGTDVKITLEINAERPAGFDDATVRTINENSRTLKFRDNGFESD